MWSVPSPSTPSLVAPINSSVFIDSNSFSKDGREIHVGDCALFKPPHDSPAFVGLIRRLIVGKEDNLSLSVNWLYRPADIKLLKGYSLQAAPNEIFYSFHQDEIPAASLLHPCKVAFLPKGVELPSKISSFVCRRVYDIETKRLWWLTDKNYINSCLTQERQEEVDQLLAKTRVEMYGALQTGGHSPKPVNGQNGTTQLKSSTDNIQNGSPVPSQVKSKKREHGVHSTDSVKRERLSKADDADSAQLKPENMLKTEVAKITDKGGLVDFEGVEKLIQLMRPESPDKKLNLASRVMLVDVISVTERFDCLTRFVQRRGLHVIDEWLQEVHKGKIGDSSPKSSEKSIDEFLFALLRALDKLPVNLLALQTCNIGKSVNHLRSHKSSEIQKKARSLVDTWKKRVEAEMNVIETRSGTRRGGAWPNKSMMPEVSPTSSSRRVGGSNSEPSAPRAQQGTKPNSGEAVAKSPESPGSTKPATGSLDVPVKEEKSNSCSPSANINQPCSNEEDAPSTSGTINKNSSRKSSTIHVQKEGSIGKVSSTIKATPDTSSADNINNQRIIVRLPNTGRNSACAASEGSLEDASTTMAGGNGDGNIMSSDSCQGKEGLVVGSDDVKKDCGENVRDGKIDERLTEASKGAGSASGKTYEASYSSINALVESCAKFSEVNASVPAGDDVGMNLLASVAAGEISRSPEDKRPLPDDVCRSEDTLKAANGHTKTEQVISAQLDSSNGIKSPDIKPAADSGKEGDGVLQSHEASTSANVETQIKYEKQDDEKKVLVKTSSTSKNIVMQEEHKDSNLGQEDVKEDEEMEKPLMDPDSSVLIQCNEHAQESIKDKNEVLVSGESVPSPASEQPASREMAVKLDFDLNEVLPSDDGIQGDVERSSIPGRFSNIHTPSSSSLLTGNRPGSITVAAAAKGPFFPSENLLRGKASELGWKGSAATSAFRPAEPRKVIDVTDNPSSKQTTRALLDFDLNVGAVDDISQNNPTGGLDLNLNACEDSPEVGQMSVSFGRPSIPQLPPRSLLSGFDLNNGPCVEEIGGESLPLSRNGTAFLSNVPGVRMNNMDMGNFSSWFPPSNAYPAVVPGRGDHMVPGSSQRMLNPEIFRGPVLSSSPAVAYSSATPFQFPGFPFETNFSIPSNTYPAVSTAYVGSSGGQLCFPTIPSQLVGPSGVVSTPYRPYVMSLPGGSGNDNRKWASQGLDLNSGPGGADLMEPSGLRQLPQNVADEQLKMFQQMAAGGGGVLKRKEPVDGWDGDRISSYKHPSWQQ